RLPLNEDRESECERRTLLGLRLNPNSTTVHLNDALRYGEPETGAALLARDGIVGLPKLLKQLGLISIGNTWTCVTYGDVERAIICFSIDGDFSGIGELNRIAHKIDQDLRQAAAVAAACWQLTGHLDLEREFLVCCQRLERASDSLGNILD